MAELELATLLIRVGFRVELLPESQDMTADLQCWLGDSRMLVEITAIVGSPRRSAHVLVPLVRARTEGEEDGGRHFLVSRLLARIMQKARQLAHYDATVVLSVTVPHRDPLNRRWDRSLNQDLDMKQLGGLITLLLARVPHLSAVLLSLWDVEPLPARSGVRLANMHVVERSRQQVAYPRIRALIRNPIARSPLGGAEIERLKGIL